MKAFDKGIEFGAAELVRKEVYIQSLIAETHRWSDAAKKDKATIEELGRELAALKRGENMRSLYEEVHSSGK